jgi:uncharacterized protein (TIGR00251 family)
MVMTVRLQVRAHPGARREAVEWTGPGTLEVWVRAPARDGRANQDIQRLLSRALRVRKSAVRIVLGGASRDKVVDIEGVDSVELSRVSDGRSD